MQRFRPDFIALVTYDPPALGGRTSPVISGCQPVITFRETGYSTPAENTLTDREKISPGETAEVHITMSVIDIFNNALLVGQKFEIYEPPRLVGRGVIKHIVNKNLEKA